MNLNPDLVPSTVRQAVQMIVDGASEQERQAMLDGHPGMAHFGLGLHIRNLWSLWNDDSPLKRDASKNYGIAHPDDISGLILAWAWAIVRGEAFDPQEHCGYDQSKTSFNSGWDQ